MAGGRGLGTFKSGLKGGVHIVKRDQVEDIAGIVPGFLFMFFFFFKCWMSLFVSECIDPILSFVGKMLGQVLVTKQTGPQGKVVSKVCYQSFLKLMIGVFFSILVTSLALLYLFTVS